MIMRILSRRCQKHPQLTLLLRVQIQQTNHNVILLIIGPESVGVLKFDSKLWFCETLKSWRDFLGRMDGFYWRKIVAQICTGVTRFLDKVVVPWVVRFESWHDSSWRGAILSAPVYYLSASLQIFWGGLRERNLDCKGGNFRVESLCREVLLCKGNIKNTLESKNHWVSFIWWVWENG